MLLRPVESSSAISPVDDDDERGGEGSDFWKSCNPCEVEKSGVSSIGLTPSHVVLCMCMRYSGRGHLAQEKVYRKGE